MAFYDSNGNLLNKTTLEALTTAVTDPRVKFTASVYQSFTQDGGNFEGASRLAFVPGEIARMADLDGLFATATIDTITPATGPAAGGTPVTIKGNNLSGTGVVTFGGTNATNVKVVDNQTITATAPAHATGAVSVVVKDDGGDVTKASFYTYS